MRHSRCSSIVVSLAMAGILAACGGAAAPASAPASPPATAAASAPSSAAAKPAATASAAASASAKPVASSAAAAAKPGASGGASVAAKPQASGPPPGPSVASPKPTVPPGNPGITPAPVRGKPQLQSDAQHTGRSPYAGPKQLKLVRSLIPRTPDEPAGLKQPDIQSDQVLGADGSIYVSTITGLFMALADGAGDKLDVKWQFHLATSSGLHSTPAIGSDGSVMLGITTNTDPKTTLYDFQAPVSGNQPRTVWQYDLGPGRMTSGITVAPDGAIYAIGGAGKLAALGPDGKAKWTAQSGASFHGAPALAGNGMVYVPSTDGNLYAVVPPTGGATEGAIIWKFAFGDRPGVPKRANSAGSDNSVGSSSSPAIGPEGTIYVGANNSNFYAINPDGTLKWKFEAEPEFAGIWSSAALSPDAKTIFFGANRGGIYALNTADGTKVWQNPLFGGSVYASPTLDKNGTLYVGTTTGHVFALDSSNGSELSVYDSGGAVWSTPSIRPDGSLVTANRKGLVMEFAP